MEARASTALTSHPAGYFEVMSLGLPGQAAGRPGRHSDGWARPGHRPRRPLRQSKLGLPVLRASCLRLLRRPATPGRPRPTPRVAIGRVRNGDKRYPVLCHCQLRQDIAVPQFKTNKNRRSRPTHVLGQAGTVSVEPLPSPWRLRRGVPGIMAGRFRLQTFFVSRPDSDIAPPLRCPRSSYGGRKNFVNCGGKTIND